MSKRIKQRPGTVIRAQEEAEMLLKKLRARLSKRAGVAYSTSQTLTLSLQIADRFMDDAVIAKLASKMAAKTQADVARLVKLLCDEEVSVEQAQDGTYTLRRASGKTVVVGDTKPDLLNALKREAQSGAAALN